MRGEYCGWPRYSENLGFDLHWGVGTAHTFTRFCRETPLTMFAISGCHLLVGKDVCTLGDACGRVDSKHYTVQYSTVALRP